MGIKLCTTATRKEVRKEIRKVIRKELKDVQAGRNKKKSNQSTSVEPESKLSSPEF